MFTAPCKPAIRKNTSRSFSGIRPGFMHASSSILSQSIIIEASLAAAGAVTAAAAAAVAAVRLP